MPNIATRQSIEAAWDKASDCAALAEEAASQETRKLYERLRNSWIQVANNLQVLADADLRRPDHVIGMFNDEEDSQNR